MTGLLLTIGLVACGDGTGPASEVGTAPLPAVEFLLDHLEAAVIESPLQAAPERSTVVLPLVGLGREANLEDGGRVFRVPRTIRVATGQSPVLLDAASGEPTGTLEVIAVQREIPFHTLESFSRFPSPPHAAGFRRVVIRRNCNVPTSFTRYGHEERMTLIAELGPSRTGGMPDQLPYLVIAEGTEKLARMDFRLERQATQQITLALPPRQGDQELTFRFRDMIGAENPAGVALWKLRFRAADDCDRLIVRSEKPAEQLAVRVTVESPPAVHVLGEPGRAVTGEIARDLVVARGEAVLRAARSGRYEVTVDDGVVAGGSETTDEITFRFENSGPARVGVRRLDAPCEGPLWLIQPEVALFGEPGALRGRETADGGHPLRRHFMLGQKTRRSLLLVPPSRVEIPVALQEGDRLELAVGLTRLVASDAAPPSAVLHLEWNGSRRPLTVTRDDRWQAIELDPATETGPAVVRFEFEGGPATNRLLMAAIAEPRIIRRRSSRPPNVLIYLIDTLRADHLSCYGYERLTSTNIDALAEDGILFERAFAQAPWTKPSTASILTGLLHSAHGAGKETALRAEVTTLAELLREQGLETAAFVANAFVHHKGSNFEQGFAEFTAVGGQSFSPRASDLNDLVLPWLEGHRDRPFFLYVHAIDPHARYDPPPETAGKFSGDYRGPLQPAATLERALNALESTSPEDLAYLRALYDEEILFTDLEFGRLVAKLRELDLYDDTIVVVLSDHGEEFREHGEFGHGPLLWDVVLRVPLVYKPAGTDHPRGKRVSQAVATTSLLPTIAASMGADLLPGAIQGADLAELWIATTEEPVAVVSESEPDLRSLIRWPFKVVEQVGTEDHTALQLYHLEDDPDETHDRGAEQHLLAKELVERLHEVIDAERRRLPITASELETLNLTAEQIEDLRRLGYVE